MYLHHLSHVGSYAFPSEPIEINFDELPPIIAVHGRNEQGKTTLLDLIAAVGYLVMPYRKSEGALVNNFKRPGFIRVVWSMEPDSERLTSNILVDPAIGRTEATLHDASGAAIAGPLQKDYRKELVKRLGSLDLFLCTAYAVQTSEATAKNAWSFLRADRAERRTVLSEILTLNEFKLRQAYSADEVKGAQNRLDLLGRDMQGHEAAMAPIERLRKEIEAATGGLLESADQTADLEATLHAAHESLASLRAGLAQIDTARARGRSVTTEIETLAARRNDLSARLENNRQVLGRREEIMKAVAGLAELRGQIVTVSDQIELAKVDTRRAELAAAAYETARKARDQAIREARVTISVAEDASRHAHETAAAAKTSGIKLLETECRRVTTLRDDAVSRAALISTVPCEGAEPYAGCRFLLDAIAGRDQAPAHAAAVADLESHLASAHSALAIPPDIEALTASIDRAKGAGAAAEAIELPPVPASHTDAAPALERAKKALEQQLGSAAKIEEEERRLNVVAARIEELTGALTAVDEDLAGRRAALHTIEQEVAGASLLDSSIRDGEEMVRRTRASLDAAARARADAEREIGRLQGELAAAEARRLLADTTRVTISAERTELEDWVLLERAWRPTGIPARRVGAALPEISGFSTDLLRECYGDSLFELSFEDQRDSADEKRLLEVLDVTVRRGGETVAVEVLSGGPSVIVNEAVSLGIALYQRARSGRHLGVIMRDEVSGKLDIERAPAYVRMLRRAAALAHFRHVLFVSHQPACLDIADARIEVSHGTLTIS